MEAHREANLFEIAIPKGFKVTPEQFEQLAYTEQLARLELTKTGELIVMSPTGGEAGRKNRRQKIMRKKPQTHLRERIYIKH